MSTIYGAKKTLANLFLAKNRNISQLQSKCSPLVLCFRNDEIFKGGVLGFWGGVSHHFSQTQTTNHICLLLDIESIEK